MDEELVTFLFHFIIIFLNTLFLNLFGAVKCNLMELITKSISVLQQTAVFCICACVGIPRSLRLRRSCLCFECNLQRYEEWQLFAKAVFPTLPSLFPLFIQCDTVFPFLCGGTWLGCQVFPAMGDVSIQELAANSGSSRMFQAPNLPLAIQLLCSIYV